MNLYIFKYINNECVVRCIWAQNKQDAHELVYNNKKFDYVIFKKNEICQD